MPVSRAAATAIGTTMSTVAVFEMICPREAVSRKSAMISRYGELVPTAASSAPAMRSAAPEDEIAVDSGMRPPRRTMVCQDTAR